MKKKKCYIVKHEIHYYKNFTFQRLKNILWRFSFRFLKQCILHLLGTSWQVFKYSNINILNFFFFQIKTNFVSFVHWIVFSCKILIHHKNICIFSMPHKTAYNFCKFFHWLKCTVTRIVFHIYEKIIINYSISYKNISCLLKHKLKPKFSTHFCKKN